MMASWLGGVSLSMAGLGVIHGIAGELGAIKDYHHGEVCGRLLLPFLTLLHNSEHPQQQLLITELASCLTRQAPPPLNAEERQWILSRSNSKNSLINYAPEQQRWLLEQAYA